MYVERHSVAVVSDASGDATAYSPVITGRILAISYVKTDYTDGVDFTITSDVSLQSIWAESNVNAAAIKYPRAGVHDVVGVAATLDGTRLARDHIFVANERVKIVIAAAGNAKTGTFVILVG